MGKVSGSDSGNLEILKKIENLESKLKKKPINITKNMWFAAHDISGMGICVPIVCNTEGATINILSAECFLNYSWTEITPSQPRFLPNQIYAVFNRAADVTDTGKTYIVRMEATISYNEEG